MIPPEAISPAATLAIFLLALVIIPIIVSVVLKAPKLMALGFLGVLFMFSDSTWGQMTVETSIYSRGTGMFNFSVLNIVLMISGFALLCQKLASPSSLPRLAPPVSKYVMAIVFLVFSHIVIGLMSGIELKLILGYNGIINILNMLMFMYLIIVAFRSDRDQINLLYMIMALAAVRSIFGMIRYVFFGGDTANPYKNFEQIDVKILFFDIGDNFVASLGAFCAAWLLTAPELRLGGLRRLALFAFLVLEIAAVALSFRRSSLIGLALMFALLVYRLPGRQKMVLLLFASGFLTAIATVFFRQRLQFAGDGTGGGILSSLIYDIAPSKSLDDNRFYELYAAAKSIGDNWLIGLGTWGTFTGDDEILSYHFGHYDFVHSGFGHVILKTGVIGLVVFCGLLAAYIAHYVKSRKYLAGVSLLLSDAGFAGFLFWLPTLLIGTPIIEFRTMLLLGLSLAMPFVAVGVQAYRARAQQAPNYYAVA
jgi:hypothetical protein